MRGGQGFHNFRSSPRRRGSSLHAITCAMSRFGFRLSKSCFPRPSGRGLDSRLRGNERSVWLAFTVLLSAALALPDAHAAPRDLTFATPDGNRSAIIASSGPGARPTIIVLHGETVSAGTSLSISGFARQAARRGFNAVYVESFGRKLNDLRAGGTSRADDIAMLRALIARLADEKVARPDRIFLVGISNGGLMALTAACRASEMFAGVGVIAASLVDGVAPCEGKASSLMLIAGTADPIVPYRGGDLGLWGSPGKVRGVEETARLFAHRNGCETVATMPLSDPDKRDGSHVVRLAYGGCATPVVLYRVEGGGHQIPGTAPFMSDMLGATNQDFFAAEAIMEFFFRAP